MKILQNTKLKILKNYENENFATTLLLHIFNVARQCYFEMKMNAEPIVLFHSVIYNSVPLPYLF